MGKNYTKQIKQFLCCLVAVTAVSGSYFTYQNYTENNKTELDKPSLAEEVKVELPPLVVKDEATVEPIISVDKQTPKEIIERKIVVAIQEVPDRSKSMAPVAVKGEATVKEEPKSEETVPPAEVDKSKYDTTLNSYVLNIIKTYTPGRYPYLLNTDYTNYNGVTFNISYQGRILLKANPSGNRVSHCSGITFEVFYRAMQERNKKLGLSPDDFNGMSYDQLHDFVLNWYVADGNKVTQNVARVVEKYGLGRRITRLQDARAGDFIDLSRENNTGHTVVFINWLKDNNGTIIGLKYWSSQESTKGISYKEEYFNITNAAGEKYGNVMTNHVYIARVSAVKDYK